MESAAGWREHVHGSLLLDEGSNHDSSGSRASTRNSATSLLRICLLDSSIQYATRGAFYPWIDTTFVRPASPSEKASMGVGLRDIWTRRDNFTSAQA